MSVNLFASFQDYKMAEKAVGALLDRGMREDDVSLVGPGEAHDAHEAQANGGAIVQLQLPSGNLGRAEAEQILSKYGATDIRPGGLGEDAPGTVASSAMPQPTGAWQSGYQTIPVVEEELVVGKREVKRGGARVEKVVTSRPVEEQVLLREEHVTVERRPVDRAATTADIDNFQEGTFELREMAEEAVVSKQARVVEEVLIGKDVSEHIETVRDDVRRTDVRVEELRGDFERDYQSRFPSRQGGYPTMQPAYEYGSELARDERFRNQDWSAVETSARQHWGTRNAGAWEESKEAVRYGWERLRSRL